MHTSLVCQAAVLLDHPDSPDFTPPLLHNVSPLLNLTSQRTTCHPAGAGGGEIRDWGGCICSFTCGSKHRPLHQGHSVGFPPPVTSPSSFQPETLARFFIACPPSPAVSSLHCFFALRPFPSIGGLDGLLGHHQGFSSLGVAQHISAGNVGLAAFLPMVKCPLCLSVFLPFFPGNSSHLTSQIFLDKAAESCMKLGQVSRDPRSMFPWNSSGKRVQPLSLTRR